MKRRRGGGGVGSGLFWPQGEEGGILPWWSAETTSKTPPSSGKRASCIGLDEATRLKNFAQFFLSPPFLWSISHERDLPLN